ncbi:MAG: superoxide dismutase [Ni] [Candidatus Neomarinimicrobiota bacterium]
MNLKKKLVMVGLGLLVLVGSAFAHCEIPCGIYGDQARVDLIREHVTTVEKSMDMIDKLSKEKTPDYNQLVRWVNNKEIHATMIQDIITQYFMFQRIKPAKISDNEAYAEYIKKLELLHRISVSAMKAKQGTEKSNTEDILRDLKAFEAMYFEEHDH